MTSPCPHCHAPTPLAGETWHAWDCPNSDAPKRHGDWDYAKWWPGAERIADVSFTPLPPLATLTPDERARLVAVARVCEASWEARRPKGAAA